MSDPTVSFPRRSRHWFDIAAGGAAIVVSVVSLIVAKQTADANTRLVEASTWPFLQLDSSNTDDQNHFLISLAITNSGVGPAKLESLEVFWHGKAYATSFDLMTACCGWKPPTEIPGSTAAPTGINTAPVSHLVIRAGESRRFLAVPPGNQLAAWHRLDMVRYSELKYRACYCSVFDECWTTDFASLHPTPVDLCPKPAVAYTE